MTVPASALLARIPSPTHGVWHLGPVPVRAYALCILLGVALAIVVGERRFVARGGSPGTVGDVAVFAVPLGLIGARAYHVATDPELYFGSGRHPIEALYIWRGGLGIWGGIALGVLGGWIACRVYRIRLPAFADAVAPGIVLAQAVGRFGNWFNQELFGRPTSQWWGLEIDPAHRPPGYTHVATFQPTFLFESIWDVGTAVFVVLADRRWRLGHGRVFALYVMAYTAGRAWIEYLRIDTVNHVLGLRLNVWTSIIVFIAATAYFVVVARLHPGRETTVLRDHPTVPSGDAVQSGDAGQSGGAVQSDTAGDHDDAADPTRRRSDQDIGSPEAGPVRSDADPPPGAGDESERPA